MLNVCTSGFGRLVHDLEVWYFQNFKSPPPSGIRVPVGGARSCVYDLLVGKHWPKRSGVNCKRRDQESRRWRIFDMDLEENASWDFTGNTIVKIERSLVGT